MTPAGGWPRNPAGILAGLARRYPIPALPHGRTFHHRLDRGPRAHRAHRELDRAVGPVIGGPGDAQHRAVRLNLQQCGFRRAGRDGREQLPGPHDTDAVAAFDGGVQRTLDQGFRIEAGEAGAGQPRVLDHEGAVVHEADPLDGDRRGGRGELQRLPRLVRRLFHGGLDQPGLHVPALAAHLLGEAEQRAHPPGGQPLGCEGPQALPPDDDAFTRQCADSLAYRHPGYAVPGGEVGLGRQAVTGCPFAGGDSHSQVVPNAHMDRLGHGFPCARGRDVIASRTAGRSARRPGGETAKRHTPLVTFAPLFIAIHSAESGRSYR